MKKLFFVCLTLILCSLFASCRSVYIDPTESTEKNPNKIPFEDIDETAEYFTDGSLYKQGDRYYGFFYQGYWIYVETQETTGPKGLLVRDGKEYVRYGNIEMQRIVKFNPATGVTSSTCLDPVCNHSFESGCLMLLQPTVGAIGSELWIQRIVGDWMIFYIKQDDAEYVTRITTVCYNLKTGESRRIFEEDLSTAVMTRWVGGCSFDGKYYNVKQVLDYTQTGYQQGGEGQNVLDYAPKTKHIVCEHNIETGKIKELFEIPDTYYLTAVSNKRFFFYDDTNAIYCCNRDGSNMRKEQYLDFRPENIVGTYAYRFSEYDGFVYFDLKTNEKKLVEAGFDEYKLCTLAEDGVLFDHLTSYQAYNDFRKTKQQFIEELSNTMSEAEARELYIDQLQKILYSGTTRIYMADFDGENRRLIFEEENAAIMSTYANGDFIFANRQTLNEDMSVSTQKCIINAKNGEIIIPPLLEIVTPDWYINDPNVFPK